MPRDRECANGYGPLFDADHPDNSLLEKYRSNLTGRDGSPIVASIGSKQYITPNPLEQCSIGKVLREQGPNRPNTERGTYEVCRRCGYSVVVRIFSKPEIDAQPDIEK